MHIEESKKYYFIPLENYTVSGLDFKPFVGLELTKEESSSAELVISFLNEFEINYFGKNEKHDSGEKESIKRLVDLIGIKIEKVRASKHGDLFLNFADGTEIIVKDSPYESWMIHKINQKQILNSWVIGGVGETVCFKFRDA